MSLSSTFPSPEEGLSLHLRLVEQDPTATADCCQAYLDPLTAWLTRQFPAVDPHCRLTAVGKALFAYVQHPQKFDPTLLSLSAYLRMVARSRLLNLLRVEARHHQGRVAWNVVEDDESAGYLSGGDEEPATILAQAEEDERRQALLGNIRQRCTPQEKLVLELMLQGERQTAAYAAVLGIEHWSAAEQELEVKRVKDRLKKRLERGASHE